MGRSTQEMQWLDWNFNVAGFECSRCVSWRGREGVEVRKEMEVDSEGKVEFVVKFCYLEDMIGSGGGAEDSEEASRARVRSLKFA